MKGAAQTLLCLLVLLALSSNAFAILRPRFPQRTTPPNRGPWMIIEDHSKQIGSSAQLR
jgi:hypothetical protein